MRQVFGDGLRIEVVQFCEFQVKTNYSKGRTKDFLDFEYAYLKKCVSDFWFFFFVAFGRYSNLNARFVKCRAVFDACWDISGFRAKIENRRNCFWEHMFGHLRTKFGADWIKPVWTGTLRKRPKCAFPEAEKIAFKVFWRPAGVCWHKPDMSSRRQCGPALWCVAGSVWQKMLQHGTVHFNKSSGFSLRLKKKISSWLRKV